MKDPELARNLLKRLLDLLSEHGERNWRRGIRAAWLQLTDAEGNLYSAGFENAASMYLGMTTGGSGFSEYYVHFADQDERIRANQPLDELRDALWETFSEERFRPG